MSTGPDTGQHTEQDVEARPRYSPAQLGRMTEAQVAGIEARIRYHTLPFWRRWREPRPPGWTWDR